MAITKKNIKDIMESLISYKTGLNHDWNFKAKDEDKKYISLLSNVVYHNQKASLYDPETKQPISYSAFLKKINKKITIYTVTKSDAKKSYTLAIFNVDKIYKTRKFVVTLMDNNTYEIKIMQFKKNSIIGKAPYIDD